MKEVVNYEDYLGVINSSLRKGILLNTQTDKFNSMVIAWGNIGYTWNVPTFVVYVRENRFTKSMFDEAKEFSISVPLGEFDSKIISTCGLQSGRNIDKAKECDLHLEEGLNIKTPGIKELPLTIECKVLYSQKQDISILPQEIRERFYPQDVDSSDPRANRDSHTVYVGEIVGAYIVK